MSDASGQAQPDQVRSLGRELNEACRRWSSIPPREGQGVLDAAERDRLRQLGADCHRRMLALPEVERQEAIALALDGARLYGWLQATSPDEPEWVAVIEEQFCRYGALWIHEQAQADPHRAAQALPLVDRLLELHPTQHEWLAATRRHLEQAAALIPRGFLAPSVDPAPAAAPFPWPEPLHTYRLSHHPASNTVVLPIGAIAEGHWFCDCLQYLPPGWPDAPWMQQVAGYRLERHDDSIGLRPAPDPSAALERLAGTWCVLNDIVGHRNLAHFFSDALPQLAAMRRLSSDLGPLTLLATRETHTNLGHLRRLLWPGEVRFRSDLPASFRVERLVLQPVAFNGGSGFHPRHERAWFLALDDYREGLELLREELPQPSPSAALQDHWICFSRDLAAPTEAPQGRHFSNYPELLERLSNHGVLILDPGRQDIRALHGLISRARGFMGIHGAGLANAFLAREGARMIEIRPHGGAWLMLELLGRAAGLDWQVVDATANPEDPGRSVIPIQAVLESLA
jgi:hypothetical protein